ncbi:Uncharacterized protein Fot_03560 [Forsythia ovata]|uniref:Uncharacterized protein n=1 Tax=Forsythia ovata TaxID=205694 RepID=A0ABD1XA15_9LAMI
MPRVISSSTSQENSSPSSNFSPESSGGVDRPFGVVGRPIGRNQPATSFGAVGRPYGGTAPNGAVDRLLLGGSRLPPMEQSTDCSQGAVDRLLVSGRLLPREQST